MYKKKEKEKRNDLKLTETKTYAVNTQYILIKRHVLCKKHL